MHLEEVLLLLQSTDRLPVTTSNLFLTKSLAAEFRKRGVKVQTDFDHITAENLVITKRLPRFPRARVCGAAAERGDLELFNEARRQGLIWREEDEKLAAKSGCLEIVKGIVQHRMSEPFRQSDMAIAARLTRNIGLQALRSDNLEILDFLLSICRSTNLTWTATEDVFMWLLGGAAARGLDSYLAVSEILVNHYPNCMETLHRWIYHHTFYGQISELSMLQHLIIEDVEWRTSRLCQRAARRGNLDFLIWLRDNNCPWDSDCTSEAALGGHMQLLEWAVQQGCPLHSCSLVRALKRQDIPMARYLLKMGVKPKNEHLLRAARYGTEMYELCLEYGAVWSNEDYGHDGLFDNPERVACEYGNIDLLRAFEARNMSIDLDLAASLFAIYGHHELCKQFVERGGKVPDLECFSAGGGKSLDFLNWLYERKAPIGMPESDFFFFISSECDLEMLEWAGERGMYPDHPLENGEFLGEQDVEFKAAWDRLYRPSSKDENLAE
jgi:hypothetical protein